MAASDNVTLTLDRSAALVLFDFLSRTTDEEEGEPLNEALQHKSELPALWATLSALAAAAFGVSALVLTGLPAAVLGLALYAGALVLARPRGLRDAWAYVRVLH